MQSVLLGLSIMVMTGFLPDVDDPSVSLSTSIVRLVGEWRIAFDDAVLLKKVNIIAAFGVPISSAESIVGQKAVLNTSRHDERKILLETRVALTGSRELEMDSIYEAAEVVFWVRPLKCQGPQIVGIMWTRDGTSRAFKGVILKP
jgi:hypothetical protein